MRSFILTLLALASLSAKGQSPDTLAKIDQIFTRWHNGTPGGVVTISDADHAMKIEKRR